MRLRAFLSALLLVLAWASPAAAWGPGTHMEIAERALSQLARQPQYGFLATDADARAAFLYGAIFPDLREVPSLAPDLDRLIQRVEASSAVDRVLLSTQGVLPFGFDTHDTPLALAVVDAARASGDRYFLAFALGCLSHIAADKHAQGVAIPFYMARTDCGDLGIGPVETGGAQGWYPGTEVETVVEGLTDMRLPDARIGEVMDAHRRLARRWSLLGAVWSQARAFDLHTRYYRAVRDILRSRGSAPAITEQGFLNTCRLFEAVRVFYPFATARESMESGAQRFAHRYVDLSWWASALRFLGRFIVGLLTLGQVDIERVVIGALIPRAQISQALGQAPVADVVFGWTHGDRAGVTARHGGNDEFQRLLGSGLLEPRNLDMPLDLGVAMVADLCGRGAASRFADDADWRVYDTRTIRAAAGRSLGHRVPGGGYARLPSVLVSGLAFRDAQTGAPLSQVTLADAGRTVRAEATIFATEVLPSWTLGGGAVFEIAIVADDIAGPDRVLASRIVSIPAAAFAPGAYGLAGRPTLAVEASLPIGPADRGYAVLVRYGGEILFTSDWDAVAPLAAGRPHYDANYGSYAVEMGSLAVR